MPETETTETEPEGAEGQGDIKQLRDAASRSKENAGRADKAERELAFVKAGFDTEHPLVSTLMGGYSGELTKDAVVAYMDGLKVSALLQPAEETTTAETKPETTAGEGERSQAGERLGAIDGGEAPEGTATADPRKRGLDAAFDIIERGGTRDDGATAFFAEVFGAAVKGDQRVLTSNNSGNYAQV